MSMISEALRAVHSVATSITNHEAIQPGSVLPSVPVKESAADKSAPLEFPGKHIIVRSLSFFAVDVAHAPQIGVPGAFTGTCSKQIPGYIAQFDAFKAKGIEQIAVVSVNDVFVLKAWKEHLAPEGTPVRFISDDSGAFTTALGLVFNATPLLGGVRSKVEYSCFVRILHSTDSPQRFVIVANGNKVETVAVEQVPSDLTVTDAKTILAQL
ncbi:Redoxin-domain-containing protein [Mycena sp. CBHHK59/15]|nr:Redoxin-domain-containing protein [Mycena sp. CBHHK59/15]